ncbi:MAG: winged helix-turn-helix transcriptional regulator [Deltaproteobacteria bacterium]|nr:winged helix-turn-helix transcriptional regulator [Deltaproteobacteria bacterium]
MRISPPRPEVLQATVELFKALGNEHRLAILTTLSSKPRCVHEIVDELSISQSLVSQHLRILRTTGLVGTARRGQEVVYSIKDRHVTRMVEDAVRHVQED